MKMRQLQINNFSCIRQANIDISKFTVVIGPQGSGKSVLCKLAYFCHSIPTDLVGWLFDGTSKTAIYEQIEANFKLWFPVGAWGNKSFVISYKFGEYSVSFKRTYRSNSPSDRIRMSVSKKFEEAIDVALKMALDAKARIASNKKSNSDAF